MDAADCVYALVRGGDEADERTGALLVAEFFANFRAVVEGLSAPKGKRTRGR